MTVFKIALFASAAALVSSAALAGTSVPFRASDIKGFHGVKAPVKNQSHEPGAPKCGTGFGSPTSTPDGIIAWNDTSGSSFDNAGGADFTCSAKTKIKQVWVKGYNAPANPELYNVTFYSNDTANSSDEPNDSKVVCSYTGLSGAGGGSYPTDVLTKLKLPTKCKLKPGKYWVSVQNNDSAGPWYWEVQNATGGTTNADWIDRHDVFGSGCTTFDNDKYLANCLGYTYPDWMLELH